MDFNSDQRYPHRLEKVKLYNQKQKGKQLDED